MDAAGSPIIVAGRILCALRVYRSRCPRNPPRNEIIGKTHDFWPCFFAVFAVLRESGPLGRRRARGRCRCIVSSFATASSRPIRRLWLCNCIVTNNYSKIIGIGLRLCVSIRVRSETVLCVKRNGNSQIPLLDFRNSGFLIQIPRKKVRELLFCE